MIKLIFQFVKVIILIILIVDIYNFGFRYVYKFEKSDFSKELNIYSDAQFPLRSTIRVSGDFKCPTYLRHGFDLAKVKHKAEFVGKVDTVIYTEFYNGSYMLELENEDCINSLSRLRLRTITMDITLLKLYSKYVGSSGNKNVKNVIK